MSSNPQPLDALVAKWRKRVESLVEQDEHGQAHAFAIATTELEAAMRDSEGER